MQPRWLRLSLVLALAASTAQATVTPPVVILTETGKTREGLPVLTRHPAPERYLAVLERGFSGRLLKLYRWNQEALGLLEGHGLEPAYLLLSTTQGGFPRFGFWLDAERKPKVGYVDLHRDGALSGRFGAMDQIFPHELLHVIVRQCAGPLPEGGANQVHAVGVRTDPITAWNEGFAEHAQVMAVDDPGALPDTAALAGDLAQRRRAERHFQAYRRAMTARVSLAPRATAAFPLWFGGAEQTFRYFGVKENLFAFEPAIPPRLLAGPDPYPAYLLENTLPGDPRGARKPPARALSTEGVVAALFARWMSDPVLGTPDADEPYRKLLQVLRSARPHDAVEVIRAYREAFPGDAPAVDRIVASVLGTAELPVAPEIWLTNRNFVTGTSLFDQARALPRAHTFDLNAASVTDLVTVPGVDVALARRLAAGGPYARLEDVARVAGVTAGLVERLHGMAAETVRLRAEAAEEETTLRLQEILMPYLWRALAVWAGAGLLGALLYRLVRPVPWWRAGLAGLTGALVALGCGWVLGGWTPLAPLAVFALPAAGFAALARRGRISWARVTLAWVTALLPAWLALW